MKADFPLPAFVVTILIFSTHVIAELPLAVQADRLLVKAERQFNDGDYAEAVATLDRILVLQEEHDLEIPTVFWFKYAQASQEAGLYDQAMKSGIRYLEVAGQEGEKYMAVLELLDVIEQEKAGLAEMARNMVRIPTGRFSMGCNTYQECINGEGRKILVSQPFALSRHEVTFNQWDACVADGGCNGYRPDDEGWGRGNRPVINVSWNDILGFIDWLNDKTGGDFRLPTEVEWEVCGPGGDAKQIFLGR